MFCCEALTTCFQKCCGNTSKETDAFANDLLPSFQSTYTVRRISSFGQTIIDEKGDEKEIERHSSIITYDGSAVPWTSKPAPIQPGVTLLDVKNQIEKMPTIDETPIKSKQKHRWKKTGGYKKDQLHDFKKTKPNENVQLKSIKYFDSPQVDSDTTKTIENSISHEDIFSKCRKNSTVECPQNKNYLMIQSTPLKSVSTPDLVHSDHHPILATKSNSKDCLSTLIQKPKGTKRDECEKAQMESEAEKLARQHGLDLSLYTEEALSPVNDNVKALTATNIQLWNEEPVGTLVLSVHFDILQKLLNVNINALESLCDDGFQKAHFPVIIKLTLVGSKKVVKTSKKIEDNLKSNIEQSFSFLIKDMDFRSMRISVYNADCLGKHDAIGHGLLSLQHLLDKTTSTNLKLYSQPIFGTEVGLMQVYFSYDGIMFHLTVDKVFNFDPKICKWKLYTKIAFYSLSRKVKERISNLVWGDSSMNEIIFNHSASFKVEGSGRKHSYIVITLKRGDNQSVFKSHKSLGRIMLGPCFYYEGGKKLTPWGRAILNKEELCYAFKMFL